MSRLYGTAQMPEDNTMVLSITPAADARTIQNDDLGDDDTCHQQLRVVLMSFEQVRPLLQVYVDAREFEIVAIVERQGRWWAASSARGRLHLDVFASAGDSPPKPPAADPLVLTALDQEADPETEARLWRVMLADDLLTTPAAVAYKTDLSADRQLTVALVMTRPAERAAVVDWATPALSTRALAGCFVYVCLQHCLSPRQADTFFELTPDLLTRAACQLLVQRVAKDWTRRDNAMLYRLCCDIAQAEYEGRSGSGSFAFLSRDRGPELAAVTLREPIHATHSFGARKLTAMTSSEFALLFDGDYFWGFAGLADLRQFPHVVFEGNGMWSLRAAHEELCHVSFGKPVPPARVLTEAAFKSHLRYCFPGIGATGIDKIWQIAVTAAGQGVGTNILFTPEAAQEARRLASQCIPIDKVDLTPEMTLRLTAIDGTVIADIDGAAHALGAIMDGPSTPKGTWQRGGRYNSAANYVTSAPFPAMILIVSQDGYVDIVPPIGQRGQRWTQCRYLRLSSTAT